MNCRELDLGMVQVDPLNCLQVRERKQAAYVRLKFDLRGRCRAAEWADERFLAGIPLRLAAAGGAGEFLLGGGFRHGF